MRTPYGYMGVGVTAIMGSHDVTCHPTQVNTPHRNSNQKPVLDLPTPTLGR